MRADLGNTRAEPGALQFHVHRDRHDRGLFVIYEVWRNIEALRAHFGKPYVKQFVKDSAEFIEGDMDVQWLVMVSPYVIGKVSSRQSGKYSCCGTGLYNLYFPAGWWS
jgi:quinol monooxygenase YgiN